MSERSSTSTMSDFRRSSPTGSIASSQSIALTPSRQLSDGEKLKKCILELVETERTYVKVVHFILTKLVRITEILFFDVLNSIWTICWRIIWSRWSRKRSFHQLKSTPSLEISRRLSLSSACSNKVWKKHWLLSHISMSLTSPTSSK